MHISIGSCQCDHSGAGACRRLYQTQSDQILKCTRYGKKRLVTGRVLAVITVLTAMYFLGVALFIILTNTAFGWESLSTSVQLLFSSVTLLPLNVGEFEILIAAAGYVTLLASVCFTIVFIRTATQCVYVRDRLGHSPPYSDFSLRYGRWKCRAHG